jgi:hypothetical protein
VSTRILLLSYECPRVKSETWGGMRKRTWIKVTSEHQAVIKRMKGENAKNDGGEPSDGFQHPRTGYIKAVMILIASSFDMYNTSRQKRVPRGGRQPSATFASCRYAISATSVHDSR